MAHHCLQKGYTNSSAEESNHLKIILACLCNFISFSAPSKSPDSDLTEFTQHSIIILSKACIPQFLSTELSPMTTPLGPTQIKKFSLRFFQMPLLGMLFLSHFLPSQAVPQLQHESVYLITDTCECMFLPHLASPRVHLSI